MCGSWLKIKYLVFCIILFIVSIGSCTRTAPVNIPSAQPEVAPMAILQPGEYPLWFQLTEDGLVLLESIEDAYLSAPFIPWPLAPHFRSILSGDNEILLAINRSGFLKLAPQRSETAGLGLYYFTGSAFWQQYTVGAFVFYDNKPVALLYLDDRFLETGYPVPNPRTWTFSMESNAPHPLIIPSLEFFPAEEGWNADSLRLGPDGCWYYRASKRTGQEPSASPSVRMLRTLDLAFNGEDISPGVFHNSALGEPLSAAPFPLGDLLTAAFDLTGSDCAQVISAGFSHPRYFIKNSSAGTALLVFYDSEKSFVLAILPTGRGYYLATGSNPRSFSLPSLPDGYIYTWIGMVADSLFASWEEQEEYNIGAAGFMVIKTGF